MPIRLVLSACIAAAVAAVPAAAGPDGDPDRPLVTGAAPTSKAGNNDSIWMDLGHPARPARKATQLDVRRLKKLATRPTVKCARIEYVYQCLSSQDMHLTRTRCRAGATEASCCKGARGYVDRKICGPVRNRLKRAGKTYYPGIWLCKCVEQAHSRTLKPGGARRTIRPKAGERHPPDPYRRK